MQLICVFYMHTRIQDCRSSRSHIPQTENDNKIKIAI